LQRAAPLILTALCVALPAQAGLIVIGGEGALVVGGLAAAVVGATIGAPPPLAVKIMMALAGAGAGAAWIMLAGALRHWRGVNETITSLLLTYIAVALFNHFVEGPLRDPASLNKPSTLPIADANMLGAIPGMDVHWGLAFGVVFCIACYVLVRHSVHGFALRIVAATCARRSSRLARRGPGAVQLRAWRRSGGARGHGRGRSVHGSANASIIAGYGYAGILVSFIARHNPLAIVPVALLVGGINASGGMLQRRLDLPDATVLVLQGIAFMAILAAETLYGRWKLFQPKGE